MRKLRSDLIKEMNEYEKVIKYVQLFFLWTKKHTGIKHFYILMSKDNSN